MELYFKLRILIPLIILLITILYIIILFIKHKIDIKLKRNCFDCRYYKLFDVASVGDSCRYKCSLKDRYDYHSMNDKYNLVKCKEFKEIRRMENNNVSQGTKNVK